MKELVIVRTIGIRNSMAKKAAITVAMLMRIFSNSFFLRLYLAALFVSCEADILKYLLSLLEPDRPSKFRRNRFFKLLLHQPSTSFPK